MSYIRSFLFIPGDSEKKLSKGDASGADAIILDLEDAVAPSNKDAARSLVRSYLDERRPNSRSLQIWVRINPLSTSLALDDIATVIGGAPDGIILPKAEGPGDVLQLSSYLDEAEKTHNLKVGAIKILPLVTETARSIFHIGDYADTEIARLAGLTWGAEDLSAALGATTNRDASGEWSFTYKHARSLTLIAASAAGVPAIETLYADFKDEDGLRRSCKQARSEGFSGRLAIHPAQVEIINESFCPSQEEVAFADRVVTAFGDQPGAGVIALDGKMLDIPHLKQAQKILEMDKAFKR